MLCAAQRLSILVLAGIATACLALPDRAAVTHDQHQTAGDAGFGAWAASPGVVALVSISVLVMLLAACAKGNGSSPKPAANSRNTERVTMSDLQRMAAEENGADRTPVPPPRSAHNQAQSSASRHYLEPGQEPVSNTQSNPVSPAGTAQRQHQRPGPPPPLHVAKSDTRVDRAGRDDMPSVPPRSAHSLNRSAEALSAVGAVDQTPPVPHRKAYEHMTPGGSATSLHSSQGGSRAGLQGVSTQSMSPASSTQQLPHKYNLVTIGQPVPSSATEEEKRKALTSASVAVKDVQSDLEAMELNRSSIETLDKLGSGNFATVHKARYSSASSGVRLVAVKCLVDDPNMDPKEQRRFLLEAQIMKEFSHPHVLELVGVSTQAAPWMIVTELCELGDLKSLLRAVKDKDYTLMQHELLYLCLQVASGVGYLQSLQFIHRDLAARNCFVSSDGLVKIGDFGMSRLVLQEDDYYKADEDAALPFRWMALESMLSHRFTLKSDVWSFGIVLFEVFSYGAVPYGELNNMVVVIEVERGRRPTRPSSCPEDVYAVVQQCWDVEPRKRPNVRTVFDAMSTAFEKAHKAETSAGRNFAKILCMAHGTETSKDAAQPYKDLGGTHKKAEQEDDDNPYSSLNPDHQVYTESGSIVALPPAPPVPETSKEHQQAAEYYHGAMSRAAAERVLLSQGKSTDLDGTFLIRKSPNKSGYSLSVIFEGKAWHYKIHSVESGKFLFYGTEFESLDALVEHHKHTRGKLMMPLKKCAEAFV